MTEIRAYTACLACYNEGRLTGKWHDLEDVTDKDEVLEAFNDFACTRPYHEEYAIHDSEPSWFWGDLGEWPDTQTVVERIEWINEHGAGATQAAIDNMCDPEDVRSGTIREVAEEMVEMCEDIDQLRQWCYSDGIESVIRDLEANGAQELETDEGTFVVGC